MRKTLHTLAMTLGNDPKLALVRMIQGGLVFTFGILMLMVSDNVIKESLTQEVIALLGLLVTCTGLLWTLIGYLSMSVLRIYHMIKKKD